MQIPSIRTSLDEAEFMTLRFIKPAQRTEIINLHETDTAYSPRASIMTARGLRLKSGVAIPSHVHPKREKIYAFGGVGKITVIMWNGENPQRYFLRNTGDTLVIPPGRVHALISSAIVSGPTLVNNLLVINSSNDPDDILWEPALDALLKNEHLAK